MGACISSVLNATQAPAPVSSQPGAASSQSATDSAQHVSGTGSAISYAAAVKKGGPQTGAAQQPVAMHTANPVRQVQTGGGAHPDYELVIRTSKELEWMLETYLHATGKGLHENAASASYMGEPLAQWLQKKLFWIAAIRNRIVHERGVDEIPADRADFLEACRVAEGELVTLCRSLDPNFDVARAAPPVIAPYYPARNKDGGNHNHGHGHGSQPNTPHTPYTPSHNNGGRKH